MIKRITADNFQEFTEKIEIGQKDFIPMLPFVRTKYHTFERYKNYSDTGIFLIDDLGDEYCLYHLYHLNEGDDTLRITLILPSSWEKRIQIVEKSLPNFIEWFLTEDSSKKFFVQILEYGEFQLFPTLSAYIIPILIKKGFSLTYQMYMRRDKALPLSESNLPADFNKIAFTEDILTDVIEFYYQNQYSNYLVNCDEEEVREFINSDDLFRKSAIFIKDKQGKIVAGMFSTKDDGSYIYPGLFWMENFVVSPEYEDLGLGRYLLSEELKLLAHFYPDQDAIAFISRIHKKAVQDYAALGFVPFEFWVDAVLCKEG